MRERLESPKSAPNRRKFLSNSSTALLGGALAGQLLLSKNVHAAGSDVLKVGLVGCGGRGSGAAADALRADPNTKLVAMGDTFVDRLKSSHEGLRKEFGDRVTAAESHCFVGFDAFKKVIDSDVDVVLLCTPPHFRPAHFQYAVDKGKHCFVEKPVAVDAQGVRRVIETGKQAKEKGLCVVSGLCYRYEPAKRETMSRLHDGAVGDIITLHVSYNTGTLWNHPRKGNWSDMEWQVRNWLYFTWLSGDHNVEQHVHSLDKAAWMLKDASPKSAVGLGGRQVRTDTIYGNIFDHHAVVYEFENNVKLFSFCRQMAGCSVDVSDYAHGTKGTADIMRHTITGQSPWKYNGPAKNMYAAEHEAFFGAIRSGNPINNTQYMANSTMIAIMGRMATYSGQTITWEEAINSQEDLTPPAYEWTSLATPPVPMPGLTKLA